VLRILDGITAGSSTGTGVEAITR